MAEEINKSASFGQGKNNNEQEEPIIIAQRFLNIFRQLHIFNDERKSSFNKMLLELPAEVRNNFRTLPGGAPLREYIDELEGNSSAFCEVPIKKSDSNLLKSAMTNESSAPANNVSTNAETNIINSDSFAKVLASSLAQSNAQIIKELQNARPYKSPETNDITTITDKPMKLFADESFTKMISEAISRAIENSESKRSEDNKIISQSFSDLQENLSKMLEQNNQLKIISNSDAPGDAAAVFQVKNIVDDLVKAQSKFLQETTKNQKDELSQIISLAIRESQKVSTQALVESFKQLEDNKAPTPITYAASSPKSGAAIESVEQALKAQGKEFSSIISAALKESQKNSAQTIIETIESLRKDTHPSPGVGGIKVEDIMKMQAETFREIAKAQNQEFSGLIASALKESQKQSTQTIISALGQLQGINMAANSAQRQIHEYAAPPSKAVNEVVFDAAEYAAETVASAEEEAIIEQPVKKKKKKKKKKNQSNDTIVQNNTTTDNAEEEDDDNDMEEETIVSEPIIHKAEAKPAEPKEETTIQVKKEDKPQPAKEAFKEALKELMQETAKASRKLTIPTELPKIEAIEDSDRPDDRNWGIGFNQIKDIAPIDDFDFDSDITINQENQETLSNDILEIEVDAKADDNEWEWEYEETAGEEGQDWEWEYEEVSGEEGQDWEWEYEEADEEEPLPEEVDTGTFSYELEEEENNQEEQYDLVEEEFVPEPFIVNLIGLEDPLSYKDPYL